MYSHRLVALVRQSNDHSGRDGKTVRMRSLGALAVSTIIAGTFIRGPAHAARQARDVPGQRNLDGAQPRHPRHEADARVRQEPASTRRSRPSQRRLASSCSPPAPPRLRQLPRRRRLPTARSAPSPSLPAPLKALLNIQAGCSLARSPRSSTASPQAIGQGTVARVDLGLNSLLRSARTRSSLRCRRRSRTCLVRCPRSPRSSTRWSTPSVSCSPAS